eukprot:UN02275
MREGFAQFLHDLENYEVYRRTSWWMEQEPGVHIPSSLRLSKRQRRNVRELFILCGGVRGVMNCPEFVQIVKQIAQKDDEKRLKLLQTMKKRKK